jgi:predicted nucleic acid-binding protein
MQRLVTLDSNVFIAKIKGDELYSDKCVKIIERIGTDFVFVEPAIIFTEVGNIVKRSIDEPTARVELDAMVHVISIVQICYSNFCYRAGLTGAGYNIYSADSLYLQTALDYRAILVSLDEEGFINRIKTQSPPIKIYHVKDFPY